MTEQKKIDKENTLRTWTEEKIITAKRWIDEETTQKKRSIHQRGIYLCNLGENIGSEQNNEVSERRPVLVLSNNIMNPNDPNVLIAPLSKNLETKISRNGKKVPKFNSQYFLYKKSTHF
ncbi:type II toxin-antitoxin system PemK/MazF family toxin [Niallia circulans]